MTGSIFESEALQAEFDRMLAAQMQEQVTRIGRAFAGKLDEAAEKQIVASLRARGYIIVRPADVTRPEHVVIQQKDMLIETLRGTIATLRGGGSVPPSTSAEG